jgi:hypothetical protein
MYVVYVLLYLSCSPINFMSDGILLFQFAALKTKSQTRGKCFVVERAEI